MYGIFFDWVYLASFFIIGFIIYFKKVGKSLPKIIDKNIKERNFVEITLIKKWKEIIGQDIAKYCWPIKIVFSDIKNYVEKFHNHNKKYSNYSYNFRICF